MQLKLRLQSETKHIDFMYSCDSYYDDSYIVMYIFSNVLVKSMRNVNTSCVYVSTSQRVISHSIGGA